MNIIKYIIVSLTVIIFLIISNAFGYSYKSEKCERIKITKCIGIGYNYTMMPNSAFGINDQSDITGNYIYELIKLSAEHPRKVCHKHARFFLCSLMVPMCSDENPPTPMVVKPCRELCESVRENCIPVLKVWKASWPALIKCEDLIYENSEEVCMLPPNTGTRDPWTYPEYSNFPINKKPKEQCSDRFVYVSTMPNNTAKCAMACDKDVLFQKIDREFTKSWMTAWAAICFVTSFLTVVTFALDASRFPFPERPVVMLAFCYAAYSIPYIIGSLVKNVACGEVGGRLYILQNGLDRPLCIVVFIFLYYFGMAGAIWWTILTFTWYLAARRGWSRESVSKLSTYFHVTAWVLPVIPTAIAIILRKVDGEPLTRLCYIGSHDKIALLGFVIIPLAILLFIGTICILSGFYGLFTLRRHPPPDPSFPNELNIKRLERLMVRLGLFAVFYTLPTIVVLACYIYQFLNMEKWRNKASNLRCHIGSQCQLQSAIPDVMAFVIRILMQLIVGVTTGMWIWSFKTLQTWRRVFCCQPSPPPVKTNQNAMLMRHTLNQPVPPTSSSSGRTATGFTGHTYQLPTTANHLRQPFMSNSYVKAPVNL